MEGAVRLLCWKGVGGDGRGEYYTNSRVDGAYKYKLMTRN